MADKRYNANATTDWFTPSNWTPAGVPAIEDKAIFASDSASCTLTGSIEVQGGLEYQGGYAGTFNTSGNNVRCGGFLVPSAITGTIDLRNSTVTNSGDWITQSMTISQLMLSGTNLILIGGSQENTRTLSASNINPFIIEIAQGAYYTLPNSLGTDASFYINGNIISSVVATNGITARNLLKIGANASISRSGSGRLLLLGNNSRLSGITSNINMPIFAVNNGIQIDGDFINSAFTFQIEAIAGSSFITANNTVFTGYVRFIATSASSANLIVNLNNCEFQQNIDAFNYSSSSSIVINNILNLTGTNDQSINTTPVTNIVSITANKPAGNITFTNGNTVQLVETSRCSKLINQSSDINITQNSSIDCDYEAQGTAKFYGRGTVAD
jgi:hypothetical protein